MPTPWIDADIGCPFYLGLGEKCVFCEAPAYKKSRLCWKFSRRGDLELHLREYCGHSWDHCEIYRMLMRSKYQDT